MVNNTSLNCMTVLSYLCGVETVEGEEDLRRDESRVLIEEVLHEDGDPLVVPVAVHQQGPPQVLEPRHGEVRAPHCLSTLLAHDPCTQTLNIQNVH